MRLNDAQIIKYYINQYVFFFNALEMEFLKRQLAFIQAWVMVEYREARLRSLPSPHRIRCAINGWTFRGNDDVPSVKRRSPRELQVRAVSLQSSASYAMKWPLNRALYGN